MEVKMTKDQALDLALEALEMVVVDVKTTPTAYEAHRQAITAIKQALAAPVQEPVAWMYEDMMGLVGVRVQKEKPIVARPVTPLYTTPPAAAHTDYAMQNRSALTLDSPMKFGGCPFCGSQSCVAGQCRSATPPKDTGNRVPKFNPDNHEESPL